ncbi:MAG TPA: MBL fold metallo-hydrolase, partial [Campylobacterales bacterium]|nr:MBL fold metallo-hydrolase [Campylobacterales bacterium]
MSIKFNFFKAKAGDSILVSTNNTNILIDGGYGTTYKNEIKPKIEQLDKLDLVVLTHTDEDHICGLIEMLNKHKKDRKKINELWFNSTEGVRVRKSGINKVSSGNGILLQYLIKKWNIPHSDNIFLSDKYQKSYSFN